MNLTLTQFKQPKPFNTAITDGVICLALIAVIAVTTPLLLLGMIQ